MYRTMNGDSGTGDSGRMPRISNYVSGCQGFTYVALAVIIFIMGISLTVVRPTWTVTMKIDRETELLYIGKAFRDAIKSYYDAGPPNNKTLPARLDDLLSDPRSPGVKRYLRKIYRDPMTGKDDWILVMDGAQRVKGVHSRSETEPFKKDHFPDEFQSFTDKMKYSEWVFEFTPGSTATQTPTSQSSTQQPQTQPVPTPDSTQ